MDNFEPSGSSQNKQQHGMAMATSSTPYFLSRNNNRSDSLNGISEESIDFYGTTKSSNVEDSPGPENQGKSSKVGLDPKYLQPAVSDNKLLNPKDARSKPINQQSQKGKENINLPIVNYREKKTARGSTYRATPVSAYFP